MPNIHLEYLPKYTPDYNLIKLVWHSAKEYIANRVFKSIKDRGLNFICVDRFRLFKMINIVIISQIYF